MPPESAQPWTSSLTQQGRSPGTLPTYSCSCGSSSALEIWPPADSYPHHPQAHFTATFCCLPHSTELFLRCLRCLCDPPLREALPEFPQSPGPPPSLVLLQNLHYQVAHHLCSLISLTSAFPLKLPAPRGYGLSFCLHCSFSRCKQRLHTNCEETSSSLSQCCLCHMPPVTLSPPVMKHLLLLLFCHNNR